MKTKSLGASTPSRTERWLIGIGVVVLVAVMADWLLARTGSSGEADSLTVPVNEIAYAVALPLLGAFLLVVGLVLRYQRRSVGREERINKYAGRS